MNSITSFKRILLDFSLLPKRNMNPTFMDLCQISGDRFEERCSQILKFYFSPDAPHRLRNMMLCSLLEAIDIDFPFSIRSVKVSTEEMTSDGKFIDITIVGDNFVIAIENKIGATLYNPLESYVTHIFEKYKSKKYKYFIVLSARSITDAHEIAKIKRNGYIYLNYSSLFHVVKHNLGHYAIDADQSYVTFLFDFMRTIEKKYYNTNMELNKFFFSNRENIEALIEQYDAFKNGLLQIQKERIALLKNRIGEITNAEWWAYQGWDLGISFNDKSNRLGIESNFSEEAVDNPLGYFHIYITTWRRRHFYPYEAELKAAFDGCFIDYDADGDRIFLHLPRIDGRDTETILKTLSDCFNTVKAITDKIQ